MMLGESIKRIRNSKGIGLNEAAKKSGISGSYLSDIENGKKKNPSMSVLETLAGVLGVNVSDFFNGTDSDMESDNSINESNSSLNSQQISFRDFDNNKVSPYNSEINDVKTAMDFILNQPGLMLNGELLSDDSKIALANAIALGLQYAEQMEKQKKEGNK